MFEIIMLTIVSLYFIQQIFISIGAKKKFKRLSETDLPNISIIVAARNEEENILHCMEALNESIYDRGKIEVIIANDSSSDKTGEIIEKYIADKPMFRTIIPKKGKGSLQGKANAIHRAIEVSSGDIILTTDADCAVKPTWAKTIASYFTENVAFVGGFTSQQSHRPFYGMQDLDFIALLTVAAGTINFGTTLSCIGNNMAYRKDCYYSVGGYERIEYTVTEDFQLLMALDSLKDYKIIYPMNSDSLITSVPCKNLKELYWQKKRWGVGGLKSGFAGFFVVGLASFSSVGLFLTPLFFSSVSLYLALFKISCDLFFLIPVYRELKMKFSFINFLAFVVYFNFYVVFLPILVFLSKRVEWKERTYNS